MPFALKVGNKVREVFATKPELHPDLMKDVVEVSDDVQKGWDWSEKDPKPPVVKQRSLQDLKDRKCDEVDQYLANKFETETVQWKGHTVQVREKDQQRLIAKGAYAKFALLVDQGQSWPADSKWIMSDNQQVEVTALAMSELADTVAHAVETLIFKARMHKDAILALATAEEVQQYDFMTGWN